MFKNRKKEGEIMAIIKGDAIANATEYELLEYYAEHGIYNGTDYECIEGAIINEDGNEETGEGYYIKFSKDGTIDPSFVYYAPQANMICFYCADEFISSITPTESNGYMFSVPEDCDRIDICWYYADVALANCVIYEGSYQQIATNTEINFDFEEIGHNEDYSGVFTVRAHATGYDSSDYSNHVTITFE